MILPKKENLVLRHDYFMGDCNDRSGNGNNGTLTGCRFEKRPDQHLRFSGTDLVTVADSSELQLTQGTIIVYGDFEKYSAVDRIISKRDVGGNNYDLHFNGTGRIDLIDAGGTRIITTNWGGSKSIAVSFVNGSAPICYLDGLYEATAASSCAITVNDAPFLVGNFYNGAAPNPNPLKGVLIYNTVLTATEISQAHAWAMAQHGASKTVTKAKKEDANILIDGDMETVGVASWTSASSATLTKEAGTRTGGKGSKVLRVAYNGVNNPIARQTIITIGKTYRVRGWARGDGTAYPTIYVGTGTPSWIGTTSTNWQYFDFIDSDVPITNLFNLLVIASGTGYVEFDDVVVERVPSKTDDIYHLEGAPISTAARGGAIGQYLENTPFQFGDATARYSISTDTVHGVPNTKVIECDTAGLLYMPSEQAYGEWDFSLYKGADANNIRMNILGTGTDIVTGNNYMFNFTMAEALYLFVVTGGSAGTVMGTAVSYISINTWYRFKITRTSAGVFTTWFKGGAFTDWTLLDVTGGSGTNPGTNNTHTTSKYMVLDLDAGDKIANITFKPLA